MDTVTTLEKIMSHQIYLNIGEQKMKKNLQMDLQNGHSVSILLNKIVWPYNNYLKLLHLEMIKD
jgi:hypothetical protein